MKKILCLIFSLLALSTSIYTLDEGAKFQSHILIVTFDAGETYAFLPVIKELENKKASYMILAMGTSTTLLKESHIPQNKIIYLDKDLAYPEAIDRSWDRYKELNQADLKKALNRVHTGVVLSGVSSFVQKQVLQHFSNKGAYTFSFYDNFNPVQKSPYYPITKEIHRIVDNVLVPSLVVQGSVYRSNVNIVGHPTIEEWSKYPYLYSKSRTRKNWDLPSNKNIITFIGGYTDEYKAALTSFLIKIKGREDYHVLLPLHPKSDGLWEKALVKELKIKNASILDKVQATPEAVIASDLVVCHQSTVGIQALFAERPVLFYDPEPKGIPYNVAVNAWEFASICIEPDKLIEAIKNCMQKKIDTDFLYRKTGIPRDSTQIITSLLMQYRTHP